MCRSMRIALSLGRTASFYQGAPLRVTAVRKRVLPLPIRSPYVVRATVRQFRRSGSCYIIPRTTQLYDRRRDELSLDEVERIVI